MSGLTVQDLYKSFADNPVLKGISFVQEVGEILAQMPEVVKSLTGEDLKKYLKKKLASDDDEKKDD